MPDVSYTKVNWEDSPSTNTPIDAENLNKMDKGISDCATEINNRQPKTDNTLNTTAKTVPGAINEIKSALTDMVSIKRIILLEANGSNAGNWGTCSCNLSGFTVNPAKTLCAISSCVSGSSATFTHITSVTVNSNSVEYNVFNVNKVSFILLEIN